MSMLAERRQKQKWTLNPRGKWWTEDSNKFGQKMLEKMGWTKGKGLGINEQGITEFSSMSHKSDTTGMGYNKNFETWTEHQDKFGNFLQQLNGNEDAVRNGDTTLSGQSIEFKSKQSQARVHYKKFTRGKDINKYKSKDLANIFGQKELAEKIPIKVEKSDNICKTEASDFRDDWYGVFTINGGNMTDYFKLKSNYNNMSDYLKCSAKLNNDTISSNMTDNRTTESEDDQYVGFGFTSKTENTSLSSCEAETVYDANGSSTKSTKKKKKEFEIDNLHITEIDKHDTRKKLKDSDDKSNYAFDNPCLGLNSPTETTCDTSGSFTKKKKKEFEGDNLHIAEINKHETRKKLKDSDDKNNYAFDNPCLGLNSPIESTCDTNGSSIKFTKKRKKEFENDSLRITETDKHDSRKKLKDSDDKSNYAFDNPCLGLNSPTEIACDTNGSSIKFTKKRKKEFESDSLHITETDKHNTRKKLKTETIDSDCKNDFINPVLNLDAKPEEDYNGKEFEVFRTQFGLENCGLDLTDEKNNKKRVTFNDHVMLYEYNINSDKKKKEEITLDKFEVENKKSKKKRKHESTLTPITNGFVNEALDVQILHEEIKDNELNECRNKIKKRKTCKTSNLETIQESPEKEIIETNNIESEDTLDIIENEKTDNVNTDTEQKSKKKKKKKKEKEEEKTKVEDITVLHVINKELDVEIEKTTRSKKVKKDKESKEEEETTISKKCKKKKKKDKENYKSEKHPIQAEINNEQAEINNEQDTKILDKLDSKQQNDYLTESENKNAAVVETLSVSTAKEEEEKEESLEKIKHKKKKRKSINKEDSSQIDMCTVEREISDKENTDTHKEQDSIATKKSTKKEKKGKKSKDKNISDIGDASDPVDVIEENKIENAEFTDTLSKKGKVTDAINDIINSPWSVKARMSKRMLITLFHNNAISEFPGSNIKNIKGYGIDIECELE